MDKLEFTRYLDAQERDVFALEITEELVDQVNEFRFVTERAHVGEFLIFTAAGGKLNLATKEWFELAYHATDDIPTGMSKQEIILSRTWFVEYEIQDVREVQRTNWVAPKAQNDSESVREYWLRHGATRVLSVTRAKP